ncbi:MAG: HlyD family efflux transporter periplasmic adaptor subunit, partial [Cyanobacteria bacterium J06641_2]
MVSNSQPNFLPPIDTNQFLPPISRWTTFGGLFILIVLGLAVPISAVTPYKVTVKGGAVIRPDGGLRIVQTAIEGQVMQIRVKENDEVKKGDTIAIIDDSRLQTKKSHLQTNIQQAKLQLVQINAQVNALNTQIRAETDRISRTIASAQAELRGRDRIYKDKRINVIAELQEANANVNIARDELQAEQAQLKSAQANLLSANAVLQTAEAKWKRYQNVDKKAKGALPKNLLEEAQLAVEQQKQAVQAQKAVIEAQKQTIERLEQAVGAAIARRSRAQTALNPSNAEVAIATERIAQEKASGEANKASLEKERQALIKQKIEIEKQLEREKSELNQIENDLKQTIITATADGIIFKLNLRNPGQTLRGGEEVVQIVPKSAPKIIKARIASDDISKVEKNQEVQMRVNGCKYPDYGTLKGEVKDIYGDIIVPQNNGNQTSVNASSTTSINTNAGTFYEVIIEPKKLALGRTKKCDIKLGMDGRVDIITREESVLRFVLRKA